MNDILQVEVHYFPKSCPHCKEQLFRVVKMSMAWSECRNKECSFLVSQSAMISSLVVNGVKAIIEPNNYTECFNRR